jgi:CHASE2 domain-containing sensor protein
MAIVATTQIAANIAGAVITARFVQQLVHAHVLNRPHSVRTLETLVNVLLAINK